MAKKRVSSKPKAKQGKKTSQTEPVVTEVVEEELLEEEGDDDVGVIAVSASTTASRRARRLTRQQAKALSLEEEYAYVVKDLRRVFILAAIMFAGLIAVNLAFSLLGG